MTFQKVLKGLGDVGQSRQSVGRHVRQRGQRRKGVMSGNKCASRRAWEHCEARLSRVLLPGWSRPSVPAKEWSLYSASILGESKLGGKGGGCPLED